MSPWSSIFTDSGFLTDVLHRPDLPAFASGGRLTGTDEENARIVQDTLVVFGTCTVDDGGVFKDEQVAVILPELERRGDHPQVLP